MTCPNVTIGGELVYWGQAVFQIIQQRPQTVAEKVLPDSQCGFRAGRGCIDMIFCARLLMASGKAVLLLLLSSTCILR